MTRVAAGTRVAATRAALPLGYTLGVANTTLYGCADAGFTGSGGTGSDVEFDTSVPSIRQSAGSIKCTGPTVGSSFVQFLKNVDPVVSPMPFSGIGVWVRFQGGTGQISTVTPLIYFGSTPGDTAGGFASFIANVETSEPNAWKFVCCPASELTYGGGASAASWKTQSVTRVLVQRYGSADELPFWIGGVELTRRSRPKYLLIMDGQYASQKNHMLPYLDALGLKATLAIQWVNVGVGGRMSKADLVAALASGHDLMLHSYANASSGYGDTTAFPTAASVAADIAAGQNEIGLLGGNGGKFMAIPIANFYGGGINLARRLEMPTVLEQAGVVMTRIGTGVSSGYMNGLATNHYAETSHINRYVYATQLHDTLSTAVSLGQVDRAIKDGVTCVQYIHQTAAGASGGVWSEANFETHASGIAARVAQGLIDNPTVPEWYDGLFGRRCAAATRVSV